MIDNDRRKWLRLAPLSVGGALGLAMADQAVGAAKASDGVKIGVVNLEKFQMGDKAYRRSIDQLQRELSWRRAAFINGPILSTPEFKELDDLVSVLETENKVRTPDQEARLRELLEKSSKANLELKTLLVSNDKADKKRRGVLQRNQRENRQRVQEMQGRYSRFIDAEDRKLNSYHSDRLKDASKKVAQRRKLKLVLESNFVVFSSDELDITDDILSYLDADG